MGLNTCIPLSERAPVMTMSPTTKSKLFGGIVSIFSPVLDGPPMQKPLISIQGINAPVYKAASGCKSMWFLNPNNPAKVLRMGIERRILVFEVPLPHVQGSRTWTLNFWVIHISHLLQVRTHSLGVPTVSVGLSEEHPREVVSVYLLSDWTQVSPNVCDSGANWRLIENILFPAVFPSKMSVWGLCFVQYSM